MNSYKLFSGVLLVSLLMSVALVVEFRTDVSDFFFKGDTPETALMANRMQSGELSRRYILLIESKDDDADLFSFTQDIKQKLAALPHIQRVWLMQADMGSFESMLEDYLPYNKQLFSLNPKHDVPLLFTQNELDLRSANIKNVLLSQHQSWLQPLLLEDPLMLMGDWSAKHGFNQQETALSFTGMIVETAVSGLDGEKQQPIFEAMKETFAELNTEYQESFRLRITGVPVFAMTVQQQISQDVKMVSFISMALMILLFLVMFKSLRGLVWVSFILISAVAAACIMTSLVFGYMHALTVAIGTTLIGVCIDYPIHSMVHAAAEGEDAEASTKRIWPSLLLGGLTTVVGYIALSFTDHPGMQQLALFAGVGIATSLLLTRYILPHLMQGHIHKVEVSIKFQAWLVLVKRYRKTMQISVVAGGLILLVIALPKLNWTDDLSKLSPHLTTLKAEDQMIRSQLSSIEPGRFILVKANDFETALQRNELVYSKLQTLKDGGDLKSFYSLYPWLASEKLQQKNVDEFNLAMTAEHQKMWQLALLKEGLSVEKLGQFKAVGQKSLSKEKFESLPYHKYVSGQYIEEDGQVLMMTWLALHDIEKVKAMFAGLEGVQYISQKDMVNKLAADYRAQTMKVLGFGILAIMILLLLRFRSLLTAMKILFPALVSTLLVMSAWSLFGVAMGMLHLIGLLLVVAICVDYAIFTFENRADSMSLTFQAIMVSSMTTVAAFISLGFADNPALQAMAWTVAPGVVLGFLLCPLLVGQNNNGKSERRGLE